MNAITPPERRPAELPEQRRARQLDMFREMAELGMALARNFAAQALAVEPDHPEPDAPKLGRPAPGARKPDPVLAFARAARIVRDAIQLENRVAAAAENPAAEAAAPTSRRRAAPARLPPDLRRAPLREQLYKLTNAEPDSAARTALRREIDRHVEEGLRDDPDAELVLGEIMERICQALHLPFDPSRLPDSFLGMGEIPWANPDRPYDFDTDPDSDPDPPDG